MPTATFDITTSRPPEEAFAFVADLRNMPRWYDTIDSAELVAGTPGEVGARFLVKNERRLRGDITFDYKTVEAEPGRRVVVTLETQVMTATETYALEPTGEGGTRIAYTSEYQLTGLSKVGQPFAPILTKLYEGPMARQLREALEAPPASGA